jgi:hypothetical protein
MGGHDVDFLHTSRYQEEMVLQTYNIICSMKNNFIFLVLLFLLPDVPGMNFRNPGGWVSKSGDEVINDDFRGIGFHVFYHLHDAPKWHYEEIFAKRWRELNPAFARITDHQDWDEKKKDKTATYLEVMKDTDTELYFTTWDTRTINNYANEADYVRKEVDNLYYYKKTKDLTRLNYYCMANEFRWKNGPRWWMTWSGSNVCTSCFMMN